MKKQKSNPEDAARLRQKAEEQLKLRKSETNKTVSETDKLQLIHELQVHQIELELQNEELVTAKEKAEQAKENYSDLYDFAPSGYLSLTKEGDILNLNYAAARMLGKERSKLINSRFLVFLSNNTRPVFNQFLDKTFNSKEKQSCEVIIETKDNSQPEGHSLPIYAIIDGILNQNGKLCHLTVVDISKRKQAETELIVSKNKLIEAQRIAHMGNWELNVETNELLWSDEIYRIFDCEPQEFKSTYEAFLAFIHPDDREMVNAAYLQSLETKAGYQIEHRILTKHNQVKYVREKCSTIFNEEGKPLSSFGIVIDITEQKQIEQELIIAKEKAEESDRLKSAFLANMSHEIRTPMNGILGFAELLKESDLSGDKQQKYIGIIEKSGARMLNIINQIVGISKIEAGLTELDMKETNVNEQIEYVYTFFKPEAETKGIKLSFENPLPAKEAIIKTDREKLYAILANLVNNALKYTEKGSIELGYETLDTRGRAYLRFYIKDTGIGIPEDRQGAIFDRFIQADIADRMAYQGAGLGLAISKSYVEMLGGDIWVESEEGKGSTFYFTIPYKMDHQETDAQNVDESAIEKEDQAKSLKVLIVEDDELSAMLLSEYLQAIGKEILQISSGTEAVKICKNHPDIDLILMDIKMPDMDGEEVTREIRKFNKDVVIIAQTACGLSGDRKKAIEAGCDDYLAKPLIKTQLQTLIKKYFVKG